MMIDRTVRTLAWGVAVCVALTGCATSRDKFVAADTGPPLASVSNVTLATETASLPPVTESLPESASSTADVSSKEPAAVLLTSAQDDPGSTTVAAGPPSLSQPAEVAPPTTEAVEAEPLKVVAVPIDFASALAIAAGENPEVAFSRQRINEAYAQTQVARVLWVPSLRAGMNYNKHEGVIQDVAGNIIETSRGSVYSGLGAQAVGAGSPAVPGVFVNFHAKDAIFQPRITRQVLAATRQANRATTNDVLMETALAYNNLLAAHAIAAIADETLSNTQRLADVTADYAQAGQGLISDADRAKAELASRRVELRRTGEGVRVSGVRLARLLSENPTIDLLPQEPTIAPIDLAPTHCSLQELVATGLSNRPELAEQRFLVGAAVERLRRERNAPLVPSVLLGLSYGGNGGGLGDDISNYGDRMDFDAAAFWEVRNLGFGEQAARNQARSALDQARWRQVQVMDQVASEIAEAYAQVTFRREEIELAKSGITAARDSQLRNAERTLQAVGLPIETLQSIQALAAAERQYVQSVADYNEAQFRLQRALGWPVQ
jgi:outer membrane protein TolC